jgi:hypothetical protein
MVLALASATGTTPAQAASADTPTTVAIGEARFVPVDPNRPDGAAIAVLRGDPGTGPSDMLMRMRQSSGRLHVHTADYRLVVIEGVMKHRGADERESDTATLGPGSYWFQPGGQAHADTCLSERCILFVSFAGPRDARLHEAE